MTRLLHPLVFLLAVLIVAGEWVWETMKRVVHRLSGLPLVAAMEQRLRRLGPWSSLAVLLLPALILFPCKIAALWAMSHHRPVLGLMVLLGAKVLGTTAAAYLFDIVRDSARRLAWFDRLYRFVIDWLERSRAWLTRQPSYRAARAAVGRARQRVAEMRRRFGARSAEDHAQQAARAAQRRSRAWHPHRPADEAPALVNRADRNGPTRS